MTIQVPTGAEIFDQTLDDLGEDVGIGLTLAAVNNAALTVTTTDPRVTRHSATNAKNGWNLLIPSALAANRERVVNTHTVSAGTATLTTYGPNYSQAMTSVAAYLLNPKLRPQRMLNLLTDVLQTQYFFTTVPLTQIVDGDVQASGVTDWTGTGGATPTKVTTAANVPFELARSLRVLNSGANGYARPALVRIPRSKTLYVWALGRADVGTMVLRLSDASDTQIDTVTSTQEDWMFVWKQMTPASTVEEVYLSPGGSGASDDTYWGGIGFISPGSRNVQLPSWCNTHARFRGLSRAWFRVGGIETGAEPASGRELLRLREGADFRLHFYEKAANPSWIELHDDFTGYPLFLTGMRPYGDIDAITLALTETTDLDLPVAVAALKLRLLKPESAAQVEDDLERLHAERWQQLPKEERRPWRGFIV